MPVRLPAFVQKALAFFVLILLTSQSWSQCILTRLEKVTLPAGQSVGNGFIKGLLRWLPPDYNSNPSKKYATIIYFHGREARGQGTANDLCKIISDATYSLPGRIESNSFVTSATSGGETYNYLVLMPQSVEYETPPYYADEVEAFIDYAMANYRIDPTRLYLTGMSSGANLVLDYVSSSAARAQRIAAASMSSLCWALSFNPSGPANIATAALPTWFVNCSLDNPCTVNNPDDWVNAITSQPGAVAPRYSRLGSEPSPLPWPWTDSMQLRYCRPFPHDTWSALYSPLFYTPTTTNLANWFIQFSRSALPVRLKGFGARLNEGKVFLQWTTLAEAGNESFTVERAGPDGVYKPIAQIAGGKGEGPEKQYQLIDDHPLPQLSYYRLAQTDIDGRKTYLSIKTVMNRQDTRQILLLGANPFRGRLSAYVNTDKAQKVTVELADMNGRKLLANTNLYASGVTEVNLPTDNLPAGIYFLKVRGDNKSETYRVVKQ
ncbi:T9SS type A sorting domain-containing protein [Paraflavitalea sp. CAU 1676]|uniref:T9SS type A sorting domain-containing protein n=1 Tax=Paraflavitalea sp. CAU 1676 TaxID=3032598 RepID=UPI0023DB5C5F|nr:T9SS type A sorting domain-containing protein [Paraflavitalea sp. CAU 1676]MDF2186886.1 T9SS type A sorting domain-containing protein [Paraflavitalea sp. CAU 1676]